MAKPSILIVPGSFARPGLYDNIIEPIADKGYEIRGLHCPTVGLKAGPRAKTLPTMYDDAAYIAKEIAILADEGKDGEKLPTTQDFPAKALAAGILMKSRQCNPVQSDRC